jgi:hypothetical protein
MTISWIGVALATLAQFAVGFVWYMPLFGKLWGQIHCFDKLTKAEQKAMQASMGPYYGAQLLVTVATTVILATTIAVLPDYSPYTLAFAAWIGFVVPTQVAAVIFGGTEAKWVLKKIAIMAGGSLACLVVAAAILSAVK